MKICTAPRRQPGHASGCAPLSHRSPFCPCKARPCSAVRIRRTGVCWAEHKLPQIRPEHGEGPRSTSHASWPCDEHQMVLCLSLLPGSIIPTLWSKLGLLCFISLGLVCFISTLLRLRLTYDGAGMLHRTSNYNADAKDTIWLSAGVSRT